MAQKKNFTHIAQLIKKSRLSHPNNLSQSDLSHLLGYKNGQFISNVERALCNIPLKILPKLTEILAIDESELKEAILKDHEKTIEYYLTHGVGAKNTDKIPVGKTAEIVTINSQEY